MVTEMRTRTPPPSWRDLFHWLIETERFADAQNLLTAAWPLVNDGSAGAKAWHARAAFEARDYARAAEIASEIARATPHAEASFNAGIAALLARRFESAEAHFTDAIALRPTWADPRLNRALAVEGQGRIEDAQLALDRELARLPEESQEADFARFKLSWHRARLNDWKTAFRWQRRGRKLTKWGAYGLDLPIPMLPDGAPVDGRKILVIGEGGFGDEIAHVRFGQSFRARGASVSYSACHPALAEFVAAETLFDEVRASASSFNPKEFDFWCAAHDVPAALGLDALDLGATPYLQASPSLRTQWRERIAAPKARLRVGLRWRGAARQDREQNRALPLQALKALIDEGRANGAEFFSFQTDETEAEGLLGARSLGLIEWSDTAAALACVDVLLTSCTATAHAAAAQGIPTWVFVPITPALYWAQEGDRSPWYGAARVFRQGPGGDWTPAFDAARAQLQAKLREDPGAKT